MAGPLVEAAQGAETGLERGDDRQAFARGGDDGLLNDAGGLIDADGQIGQQPVDLLGLGGRDRRGPRRLVGDGRGLGRDDGACSMSGRTSRWTSAIVCCA